MLRSKLNNTEDNYGAISKFFHWGMALLIIFMLVLGNVMGGFEGMDKLKAYGIHKSTGIVVLFMVFLRLTWRQVSYQPKVPDTGMFPRPVFKLMEFAADASHFLIYVLMFAMPISGLLLSSSVGFPVSFYGLFVMPDFVEPSKERADLLSAFHYYASWALIGLLVVHVGAALFHRFYIKDNVLQRMLP